MDDHDWLSAILKSIGEGVIAADKKGHVSFINSAAEAMTGWSKEAAAGKALKEVFNLVDQSTGKPAKDVTPKAGEASHVLEAHRYKLVAKDGSAVPVEGATTLIKEGPAGSKGLAVVFKQASATTSPSLHALAADLVEQAPIGLLYCDMNGEIVLANRNLAAMHGRKVQDVAKKHRSVLHTPDQMQGVDEGNLEVLEKGDFKGQLWHTKSDGTTFSTFAQSTVVRDKSGKPLGIITSLVEVGSGTGGDAALCMSCKDLEHKVAQLEETAAKDRQELEASKRELQNYVESLEKINEALKLVIEGIEEQKKEEEKKVSHNISLTIRPILDQLKSQELTQTASFLLKSLEFNLGNMFSSAGFRIIKDGHLLTPKEIRICEMIGSGLSSKQIAKVMGISPQTVLVHRKNIRKKLGLAKSRHNLASYLRANL